MPFWDHFDADDAANIADDLGEPVTLVMKRGDQIIRREIDAIIHRQPNRYDQADANGASTLRVQPIRIVIPNGGPRGVSSAELDIGLDGIELHRVAGDPSTLCTLSLHMPGESEKEQNNDRFHTFSLY